MSFKKCLHKYPWVGGTLLTEKLGKIHSCDIDAKATGELFQQLDGIVTIDAEIVEKAGVVEQSLR